MKLPVVFLNELSHRSRHRREYCVFALTANPAVNNVVEQDKHVCCYMDGKLHRFASGADELPFVLGDSCLLLISIPFLIPLFSIPSTSTKHWESDRRCDRYMIVDQWNPKHELLGISELEGAIELDDMDEFNCSQDPV